MPRNEFCGNSAALLLVIVSISSTSLNSVNTSTVKMVLPQIGGGHSSYGHHESHPNKEALRCSTTKKSHRAGSDLLGSTQT